AAEGGGAVALAGVSVGATVALLAAERPELAGRATLVAGIAPYADLVDVIRAATTATTAADGGPRRFRPDPFVGLVVARSLLAGLPAGAARDELLDRLRRVHPDADAPLGALEGWPRPEGGGALPAVLDLLANRDPERFEALYARLPEDVRRRIDGLSPIHAAARIEAPVELASAPRDKYFPLAHSRALAAAVPRGRLTVTRTLDHAIPAADLDDLRDLGRFYGFLVRSLDTALRGR
ncbi:MAG TPA: hypothetical protein VNJ53_11430, partial [Gaiellaceae bacterium]|nr:hypothetical protein [Gaiellaceae bacterium]